MCEYVRIFLNWRLILLGMTETKPAPSVMCNILNCVSLSASQLRTVCGFSLTDAQICPATAKETCMLHQGQCKKKIWISAALHIHPHFCYYCAHTFPRLILSRALRACKWNLNVCRCKKNCEARMHIGMSDFHCRSRLPWLTFGSWLICLKRKTSTVTNPAHRGE